MVQNRGKAVTLIDQLVEAAEADLGGTLISAYFMAPRPTYDGQGMDIYVDGVSMCTDADGRFMVHSFTFRGPKNNLRPSFFWGNYAFPTREEAQVKFLEKCK